MEFNVDNIMEKIRNELRERQLGISKKEEPQHREHEDALNEILFHINQAQEQSNVGFEVPNFTRYKGLTRKLAKKVAKVLLYFLRVVTNPQRLYNQLIVQTLKLISIYIEHIDEQLNKIKEHINIDEMKELTDINEIKETINNIKLHIDTQDHQMTILLANLQKNANHSMPKQSSDELSREQDRLLDAFYLSFEDQFRGTREDIKNRLRIYLPYIDNVKLNHQDMSFLDLGCGRGEWLELLKDNGFKGKGVDSNRMMVKLCQDLELDVIESDVISYLSELQNNSISIITGFHIVEHLPFNKLIYLIDEIYRILTPAGFVILETPNPENIIVGSCTFYIDPTHINPIPLESLKYILESRSLSRVEIRRLHPLDFIENNEEHELKKMIWRYNCAQDYAAIGFKGKIELT